MFRRMPCCSTAPYHERSPDLHLSFGNVLVRL